METAAHRRPLSLGEAALIALVAVFPLGPRFATGVGNVYLGTLLALGWLAAWALFVFAGPRGGLSFESLPQKAMAVYTGFLVLQIVLRLGNLLQDPASLLRAVQLVGYMSLFVAVSSLQATARLPRSLLRLSYFVLVVECAVAWLPQTYSSEGQQTGTFDQEHNSFAAYLLLMLCVLLGALFLNCARRRRLVLGLLSSAALVALVFTLSRTAYIALPVAVLAMVHRRWGLRSVVVAAFTMAVIVAAAVFILPLGIVDRMSSLADIASGRQHDISFTTRLVLWQNALEALARSGFVGVGIYSFLYLDSYFVRALVETGPLGLALYLWVLVATLRWLWRSYARESDPVLRGLSLGLYGATVGMFLVMNLTMDTLLAHRVMGLYWVLLGALVAARRNAQAPPRIVPAPAADPA